MQNEQMKIKGETVINTVSKKPKNHLPECESIRGIAILLVFCFHYLGSLRGYMPYPEMNSGMGLLFGGNTGVTLFFLLSGFLLTRPFLLGSPLQIKNFLVRRALRILPMFYFTILIGALISGKWEAVIPSMFFHGITLGTLWPMGAVWWSLVVEVQFYLLLPLIVWVSCRPRWRFLLAPLLACGIYSYMITRNAPMAGAIWDDMRDSILGRWPIFLVGAGLAWAHQILSNRLEVYKRKLSWPGLLLILLSLGILIMLCDYRFRIYGIRAHVLWYDHYLLEALAWSLFVFILLNFRFPGYRLFVNPVLHHIGLWSYSLYLLHSAVLHFTIMRHPLWAPVGTVQTITGGILLLLVATAISALTYRYIERPFLNFKPKMTSTELRKPIPIN